MNLNVKELNELIYSLGITTFNGKFTNKELNESLLEKLYEELNRKIEEDVVDDNIILSEKDADIFFETIKNPPPPNEALIEAAEKYKEGVTSHYMSNEEADEDANPHMLTSFPMVDPFTESTNDRYNGVTQAILDYVEKRGIVTHSEMHSYYKAYTAGSNSFSHILKALRIPYKNRPTRRYLVKSTDGTYRVFIANKSNWVEND